MFPKTLRSLLLIAILLSACKAQPTQTPTTSPTETPVPPTETLAPTFTPDNEDATTAEAIEEPTATATPLPPENTADCTNAGKFISDITIPDNSNININETFTKTWRVQNVGTCIWWYGYSLAHYSEETLGIQEPVPLPLTNPGETVDISVVLVAPETAGSYRGNFVIYNPEGLPMQIDNDSRLWVLFNAVESGGAQDSTPESGDQAACNLTVDTNRTQELLNEINGYRASSGLAAYPLNDQLTRAAQSHAADMACNQLFYHDGSDGSTPESRVIIAGYTGTVTENVYGSYPPLTPAEVKDWWRLDQTDPSHNLNLVSTKYVEAGIGYAFYNNFGYYVVVFGTP